MHLFRVKSPAEVPFGVDSLNAHFAQKPAKATDAILPFPARSVCPACSKRLPWDLPCTTRPLPTLAPDVS